MTPPIARRPTAGPKPATSSTGRIFHKTGRAVLVAVCILMLGAMPLRRARAQSFDLTLILLLTGPVSEAVQETVLLIRRGDHFISLDSLAVACAGGGSAGAMVSFLPMLGVTPTGAAVALALGYVVGATSLGCSMAMIGSLAGMATQKLMDLLPG